MILMLIIWRSRALHPIRSTNTPMSRRSEKVLSNWEEVCKGIHFIGFFCSQKQFRPEVHHGLLRAGCFFWHNVFFYHFLWRLFWMKKMNWLVITSSSPCIGTLNPSWRIPPGACRHISRWLGACENAFFATSVKSQQNTATLIASLVVIKLF